MAREQVLRSSKRRSSVFYGRVEFSPVGKNNFAEIYVVGAAFDAMADQSDLVSGLHGILRPALAVQNIRTIGLGNPFFNFSIFVRGVEVDERVGVDPLELRYDSFHGSGRRHVVIRPAVMREHRTTDDEKTNGPNEHTEKSFFHLSTLCDFYPTREQNHMPAAL